MKSIIKITTITPIFIVMLMLFNACNNAPKTEPGTTSTSTSGKRSMDAKVYQCSMHPHIVKDEAGNCPVCGMELEQKSYHDALMYLSNYKKGHPDYKEGDDLLKDMKM